MCLKDLHKIKNMQINPKEHLRQIECVYKLAEESKGLDQTLKNCAEAAKPIEAFYGCNSFEAIILCICLHFQAHNKIISNASIATVLKLDFTEMAELVQALRSMVRKELIRSLKDRERGIKYQIPNDIWLSAFTGKVRVKKKNDEKDEVMNLLKKIRAEILRRYNDEISSYELLINIDEELSEHQSEPFVQWVYKLNLEESIRAVFLNACFEFIVEDVLIDIEFMCNMVMQDNYDRYCFKKTLANGSNELITKNLIEFNEGNVDIICYIHLSNYTREKLLQHHVELKDAPLVSKHLNIYLPESIQEECLLFNYKEEKELQRLHKALSEEGYKQLEAKLKEKSFSASLTITLYGKPGTGKTATAYQLAKQSSRVLLVADVASIKSMWLGESEKNLKALFSDYRRISKQLDKTPILLFNEADALISKRVDIIGGADQTMNALQNILLQELENFEGIFIGTTNLVQNMDPAFERRFLFKLLLTEPNNDVKLKLLSQAFPAIDVNVLEKIALQYNLTGSNIKNIKKKAELMEVIDNQPVTATVIGLLAKEETFQTIKSKIGFSNS